MLEMITLSTKPIFTTLLIWGLYVSNIAAGQFNYTQCGIDAKAAYMNAPNRTILYDQNGSPTSDLNTAWGISYELCDILCTPEDSWTLFTWNYFAPSFTSWLLPWLALTAQLPYETKDRPTSLLALFLAIGSPMLIIYSLSLTILNARWINKIFKRS